MLGSAAKAGFNCFAMFLNPSFPKSLHSHSLAIPVSLKKLSQAKNVMSEEMPVAVPTKALRHRRHRWHSRKHRHGRHPCFKRA